MELLSVTSDDAAGAAVAARWQAVEAAAHDHDYVALPADPVEEVLAAVRPASGAGDREEFLLGTDAGADVVAAKLRVPLRDNLTEATLQLRVHPDARRRGYATATFPLLVARCRELGRTRLLTEVPGRPDNRPSPAQRWARRLGFAPKLVELRRLLDVRSVDDAALAALEADAAGHATGYRLLPWTQTAPAQHVPGLAVLSGRLALDAPTGDLAREAEDWDAERWLARERLTLAKNRLRLGTMVLRGEEVVAYTDFGINRGQPTVGYQWDSIVRADHRGHRLGLLMKIANLRQLRETSPATRWVNTWNAADNTFMASINEALGWRVVDTWTECQLDL